jgi:hypothetical protein
VEGVSSRDVGIIQELKRAVAEGGDWYVAVLEAVRLWHSPEEDYQGRHYSYVVDNEAFDWLVLAERLCEELDGLIPEEERLGLLFFASPPARLSRAEFRKTIGAAKYQAHLNYFYGITVERFLILAVMGEIRKERRATGLTSDDGVSDEAYRRVYGTTHSALLKEFRRERRYPQLRSIGLSELNEFTYWLFKYRVKIRDGSCVASDTKKALTRLHGMLKLKVESYQPSTDGESS